MDEIEFLKAKEKLLEASQTYIDKRFETEKGLIRDYLGFAGKVAVAGVGIAIITVGFFGLKTYDDVNKSIKAEIKSRFDNDNPVTKYELMVREAAIQGIIASLTARIQQPSSRIISSEEAIGYLTRALQDEAVSADRKSEILVFGRMLPYRNSIEQIARAGRKLIQLDFKENRESGIRVMTDLIQLYSAADPNQFVTDALDILEKYKDEPLVVRRVAEMLDKLDGSNASRILAKLASSKDKIVTFHRVMFDLRTSSEAKPDPAWLSSTVADAVQNTTRFGFGEESGISARDYIMAVSLLNKDNRNFWTLIEQFADEARKKDVAMLFEHSTFDPDEKPYVGLGSKSSITVLDNRDYSRLFSDVARAFLTRSSTFSKPTISDLSTLEFWMAKERNEVASGGGADLKSYKPYFIYRGNAVVKDSSGKVIAADRTSQSLAIRIFRTSGDPIIQVFWRDPMGSLQSVSVSALTGLDGAKLVIRSGIKDMEMTDDL